MGTESSERWIGLVDKVDVDLMCGLKNPNMGS